MNELVPLGATHYSARVTPLKTGGRRDIEVTPNDLQAPHAFEQTDIIARMRAFFVALDDEATQYQGDPVALAQALARLDALVADVRWVRDTIRTMTAEALKEQKVRRLTIEGITTVEGTSEVKRTNWQHEQLLTDMLNNASLSILNTATGEVISAEDASPLLLEWFRPEWKMTPLKTAGLNPNDYCTVALDDDGKVTPTPSVRMINNTERETK
jgi:hypothetical protein